MTTRSIKIIISIAVGLILLFYIGFSLNIGRALSPKEFAKFSKTIVKAAILHPGQNGGLTAINLANQVLAQSEPDGQVLPTDPTMSRTFTFPLPKYSTQIYGESGLSRFATFASPKEIDEYFNKTLPESGWKFVDQMGAGYFFEGQGLRMTITKHFYLTQDISELNVSIAESWQTYANEKYSYSVEYPAGWHFQSISADADLSQQGPNKYNIFGGLWYVTTQDPGKYNISNLPENPFEVDFTIYQVDPHITFAKFFTNLQFDLTKTKQEAMEINGKSAFKLSLDSLDSNTGKTGEYNQVFIKQEDKVFLFSYHGYPISDENRDVAEKMIQSFKVK